MLYNFKLLVSTTSFFLFLKNIYYDQNFSRVTYNVFTKAMRSVKRYACYAKNPEFRIIPMSVITVTTVINVINITQKVVKKDPKMTNSSLYKWSL